MAIRALKILPWARAPRLRARRRAPAADNDSTKQIAYTFAVIGLAARLAEARGGMTAERIHTFCHLFGAAKDEAGKVGHLLRLAARDKRDVKYHVRRINALYPHDSGRKQALMQTLFRLAEADGPLTSPELEQLRKIASAFSLAEPHWLALYHHHIAPRMDDPYATLGIRRSAGEAEMRDAYRARVRACHPDLLAARGAPKAEVARAARDMAALNAAYDALTRTAKKRA